MVTRETKPILRRGWSACEPAHGNGTISKNRSNACKDNSTGLVQVDNRWLILRRWQLWSWSVLSGKLKYFYSYEQALKDLKWGTTLWSNLLFRKISFFRGFQVNAMLHLRMHLSSFSFQTPAQSESKRIYGETESRREKEAAGRNVTKILEDGLVLG